VIAGAEFKLKYSDSMLGYVWSLLKPLGLFSMLYIVFGRFFKLNVGIDHYPLYLRGVDVGRADNHHVLEPVNYIEVALVIDIAKVARMQPTLA
jgi:hypothetical protein